jgi:hypothetical protein
VIGDRVGVGHHEKNPRLIVYRLHSKRNLQLSVTFYFNLKVEPSEVNGYSQLLSRFLQIKCLESLVGSGRDGGTVSEREIPAGPRRNVLDHFQDDHFQADHLQAGMVVFGRSG